MGFLLYFTDEILAILVPYLQILPEGQVVQLEALTTEKVPAAQMAQSVLPGLG